MHKKIGKFFAGSFLLVFLIYSFISLGSSDAQWRIFQLAETLRKAFEQMNVAAIFIAAREPDMCYVTIVEGMRKEEVARRFGERLDWNNTEVQVFGEMLGCYLQNSEGYLFPGGYAVPKDSTPDDVKKIVFSRLEAKTREIVLESLKHSSIDLKKALIIASLIQREAGGKTDMPIVSGIIWNRLHMDMTLDLDATLQYAKGNELLWWPRISPKDKNIRSPFNTYKNKGLPPAPIANPGLAAILAAINPEPTNCLYYLHDRYGRIHCSETYAGHKQNVNMYLK